MNASDRAAIRWALRRQPNLLAEVEAELGLAWYDAEDARQRDQERRLAEHDAAAMPACNHWDRADWIDVNTCGCGERVL